MPAVEAYRMATLYPATYFRLDSEVGGIAPGRVADLLFLSSPHEPTPVQVMVNGKLQHAETEARLQQQQLQFPWDSYLPPLQASAVEIAPAWFQIPANPTGLYPIIKLENAVITRLQEEPLPVKDSQVDLEGKSGYLLIAVLDKELRWITRGIIHGFAHQLHALASTYNSINEIVVLGSSPAAMARAVEQVLALGGGIVLVEGDEPIYQLPLPLAGLVSPMELEELIPRTEELVQLLQERGYTHADPFYSLFFFTTTHLPTIRLTAQGLYLVKEREVIQPSERL